MKRREPPSAEWGDNDQAELSRDREIADKYGFEVRSVTSARYDLIFYMQFWSTDPFAHHIKLRQDIIKVKEKLLHYHRVLKGLLDEIPNRPRLKLNIDDVLDGIQQRAEHLDEVREALPTRCEDIKTPAVQLLIAYWVHEPIRTDTKRDLDVTASVFDNTPSHAAMKFVREMFERFDNQILGQVSGSTMRRALVKCGNPIPTVKQLAPYEGDPEWLS